MKEQWCSPVDSLEVGCRPACSALGEVPGPRQPHLMVAQFYFLPDGTILLFTPNMLGAKKEIGRVEGTDKVTKTQTKKTGREEDTKREERKEEKESIKRER